MSVSNVEYLVAILVLPALIAIVAIKAFGALQRARLSYKVRDVVILNYIVALALFMGSEWIAAAAVVFGTVFYLLMRSRNGIFGDRDPMDRFRQEGQKGGPRAHALRDRFMSVYRVVRDQNPDLSRKAVIHKMEKDGLYIAGEEDPDPEDWAKQVDKKDGVERKPRTGEILSWGNYMSDLSAAPAI